MPYKLIEAKARTDGSAVPPGEPIEFVYNYAWAAEIASSDYFPQATAATPETMDTPSTWLAPEITDFQAGEITQERGSVRPKDAAGVPIATFGGLKAWFETDYAQRRAAALKKNQDAYRDLRLAGWDGTPSTGWSFIDT